MIRWLKAKCQTSAERKAEIRAAMLAAQAKEYAAKLEVARLKRALRKWGGWEKGT
jgi:hypothetical protein